MRRRIKEFLFNLIWHHNIQLMRQDGVIIAKIVTWRSCYTDTKYGQRRYETFLMSDIFPWIRDR